MEKLLICTEAKLITENGFCISLATDPIAIGWIINVKDKPYDKQDCEQKAFKRLEQTLKKAFPRLPICILADALYASSPVMDICESNQWKYIITLQDGSPSAIQNCLKDDPPTQHNSFAHQVPCNIEGNSIPKLFYWVQDLLHRKKSCTICNAKKPSPTQTPTNPPP